MSRKIDNACHQKKQAAPAVYRVKGEVPPIVKEVLRSPGHPLDAEVRAALEPRLGHDFSSVRVHCDQKAAESARAVDAMAYTVGRDMVFGQGRYAPQERDGRSLLAHELVHVVQQNEVGSSLPHEISSAQDGSEREAEAVACATLGGETFRSQIAPAFPVLMRQKIKGGGATPGEGEGADLIFIIRAPDDPFTSSVTEYVKTVLHGQSYTEVDNLAEIFDKLSHLKARVNVVDVTEPAVKVRRIRIVAHGSTTGGVKMTPKGETRRRWVGPEEVATYAKDPQVQATLAQVLAPGAQIEFWGCNVGAIPKTGEAWSAAFGAQFTATSETFKTEFDTFARPAARGEVGEVVPGQPGRWVTVTNSAEIDSGNRRLQRDFNNWLMARYSGLVQNGDILPVEENARMGYMRELFDRAGGKIRHIVVEKKNDHRVVRPGAQKVWLELWKTTPAPKDR